jgi:hypothetical protein
MTSSWTAWLRRGWPVPLALAALWFPFDWLATAWPAFGVPFRAVFRNAHDHFVGHTVFFFLVSTLALTYVPGLRRLPLVYLLGLVAAALVQETVQAIFRGEAPTYTDFNAFKGDALGGALAFLLWAAIGAMLRVRESRGHRQGES